MFSVQVLEYARFVLKYCLIVLEIVDFIGRLSGNDLNNKDNNI